MSTPAISLEHIADKVRRRRPIRNLKGDLIALDTEQQCIIRYMCAEGLQQKQIAIEMGISQRDISTRLASAMRISGCKTHAQLGAWAAKAGLV